MKELRILIAQIEQLEPLVNNGTATLDQETLFHQLFEKAEAIIYQK